MFKNAMLNLGKSIENFTRFLEWFNNVMVKSVQGIEEMVSDVFRRVFMR